MKIAVADIEMSKQDAKKRKLRLGLLNPGKARRLSSLEERKNSACPIERD